MTTTPPPPPTSPDIAAPRSLASQAEAAGRLLDEIELAVIGKRTQLRLLLAGLLAGGHVLLDDVPGVAKTLAAKSLATAAALDFARVQFTPDVLPSDITGYTALDGDGREQFRPGPVFANLVLADEINRAPAKTQAALLEAMAERHVTLDGTTHALPDPFHVIATQNPIESEGTYPLPEAQLDRFILRTSIGYPDHADEVELLRRRIERQTEQPTLRPVLAAGAFAELQRSVEKVWVHPSIVEYTVTVAQATRNHRDLELGASPRGSLALTGVSRAFAVLDGRDFVTPDDVRAVAIPTLAHRVALTDEAWARGTPPNQIVSSIVDSVPTPSWQ